jgi:protein required for attachment to host cells
MIDEGTTWILAADGARARVFEERRRSGELIERTERAMHIEEADRPRARGHPATVHQRLGSGRHAGKDDNPAREAETRFLARVVEALDSAAARREYDRLVIVAPPTALGALRAELTAALKARLDASDAHDRTGCNVQEMRTHLRKIRALA